MKAVEKASDDNQELFFDIIKRAYENGTSDEEITIQKLMDELIMDLKMITG